MIDALSAFSPVTLACAPLIVLLAYTILGITGFGASITAMPLLAHLLPLQLLTGTAGQPTSTLLIVAIATAVCSIPVISRIFWDLGIMKTRFVSLILGYALLEDLALWIVLAFATALATSATLAQQHVTSTVSSHVIGKDPEQLA